VVVLERSTEEFVKDVVRPRTRTRKHDCKSGETARQRDGEERCPGLVLVLLTREVFSNVLES
jgi:hypothetical protein